MNLIKTHSLLGTELLDVRNAIRDAIDYCDSTLTRCKDRPDPESESLIHYMNDKKTNLESALKKLNY